MIATPSVRLAVIIAATLAAVVVGIRALVSTQPLDPVLPPVVFPLEPNVPGWQAVVEEPDPARPHTQRYRGTGDLATLSLEMQFIPDLPVHYIRNPQIELRFLPRAHLPLDAGMRFYVSPRAKVLPNQRSGQAQDSVVEAGPAGMGFWTAESTANLSTIVTPSGTASMVPRTVARSLYLDHLTLARLGGWLFARESLPDRRCVLIHFSTPERPQAREVLAQAWEQWRSAHFPVFPGAPH